MIHSRVLFVVLMALSVPAHAAPITVPFQGSVRVNNQPFTGQGFFKFALRPAGQETLLWTNDPVAGRPPVSSVQIPVSGGVFSVPLGSAALGMPALDSSVFRAPTLLKVWFSPTGSAFEELSPDQPVHPVPNAAVAMEADNAVAVGGVAAADIARQPYVRGYRSNLGVGATAALTVTISGLPSTTPVSFGDTFSFGVDVIPFKSTGPNGEIIITKVSGNKQTSSFVLRRPAGTDPAWFNWWREPTSRRNVTLSMTLNGTEACRWHFSNVFPSSYARRLGDDNRPLEELTLEVDTNQFTRVRTYSGPVIAPGAYVARGFPSGQPGSVYTFVANTPFPEYIVAGDALFATEVTVIRQTDPSGQSITRKIPGPSNVENFTLRQTPAASPFLYDWFDAIMDGRLSTERRTVSLRLTSLTGQPLGTLAFTRAWPSTYRLFLADDGLPVEEVDIVSESATFGP